MDPRSHLICTPPRRATPPGSPQFLYWGIWASPPETDQDSCLGWLPPVPLDLVSPKEDFSAGPLTPRFTWDLSASLPPEFCPLLFVCVLCGTQHSTFTQNHCQLEEFINSKLLKLWSWMQTQQTWNNFLGPKSYPRVSKDKSYQGISRNRPLVWLQTQMNTVNSLLCYVIHSLDIYLIQVFVVKFLFTIFGESSLKSSVFQLLHKFHILWHSIWSRHFRLDCSRTLE